MHKGKQLKCKSELIMYLVILLLTEGRIDAVRFKKEFNLSNKTFCRYISNIKNVLYDFGLYYIDIYYDTKLKVYLCKISE